ncbi:hypothetical protein C8R46DRAFT_1350280 [Mycena filopes]|nr:hypothetical protein C8R46DRAFT_1350280 [Mycena filopes]
MNDLPVEIRDKIIDYSKSRRTLAACSLNAPVIADLLWSPICTIISHVRRLTLVNDGDYAQAFEDIDRELRLLVKLESLRLSGPSSWVVIGWDAGLAFTINLPTVVDLEIDCPDLGDFHQALLIISSPLSAGGASLSVCAPYAPPDAFPPKQHLFASGSAFIPMHPRPSVLSWLDWAGFYHIAHLVLHIMWDHATEYLHKLSHSLEHLEIGGVCRFTHLRSFHLEFPLSWRPGLRQPTFEGALILITHGPTSPALARVSFAFNERVRPDISFVFLDRVFARFLLSLRNNNFL